MHGARQAPHLLDLLLTAVNDGSIVAEEKPGHRRNERQEHKPGASNRIHFSIGVSTMFLNEALE